MIERIQGGWRVSSTGVVYASKVKAEAADAANAPKRQTKAKPKVEKQGDE